MDLTKLLYGGDYNPEQWLAYPEILKEDIEYMKQAHINTVTLGVFSWSVLEPEEGDFQFGWLEQIIDDLYENGISVILATPSGARPKWLADRYPEVLRVDEARNRELFGGRHNHCYTSPVYREKVRIINGELSKRFGSHPAVILWHISNEYGGECHCPLCQQAFRKWLEAKYRTIEELNERWCTTFWSHTYQSFDQIESPSSRGESMLHGLTLDWKRFVTDQTADFIREEIAAIRVAGSDKPATINLMYNYEGLNYHKFADLIDVVSWDSYPTWHKGEEYLTATDNGMQHDIMRSIKKKPYLLMESCPSSTNWQGVSKLKRPGIVEAQGLQAVAHGSDSVLYFQIRQSRGASEKFHGAVIDHTGSRETRVFREVEETGRILENMEGLLGASTESEVAVIYDWENRWALEDAMGPRNKGVCYKETVEKSYRAFRKQGLNVDVIDMEQSLEGYRIVAAPMAYMFRSDFEKKVKAFVEQGGTFVLTYWSGIVDDTDRCFLGATPHGLADVMGFRRKEIDGLYDGETNAMLPTDRAAAVFASQESYSCQRLCELVELTTAVPLAVYGEDFYQGIPAAAFNRYGDGSAYYIAADAEQAFYDDLYRHVVDEAQVERILDCRIPEGVEVNSRQTEEAEYVFVQNYNREAVEMDLGNEEHELVYGKNGTVLPPFGTVVLMRRKSGRA